MEKYLINTEDSMETTLYGEEGWAKFVSHVNTLKYGYTVSA